MTSTAPLSPPDMMGAALVYAARGWAVMPLHTPASTGLCSCRKRACDSIGKHPRTEKGLRDASTDPDQIRRWWSRWPDANIGVLTGQASGGLVVLDVDEGRGGREAVENLPESIPDTVVALTGGGGMHALFVSTDKVPCSVDKVARGLDIRGEGGYVVAAPSLHKSGRRYVWESSSDPDEVDVARLPAWLQELACAPRAAAKGPRPEDDLTVISGGRNDTLFRLACKLRRAGLGGDAIRAALLEENARRCVPPLDEREVSKIAASSTRYDAGDPYYAGGERPPAPPGEATGGEPDADGDDAPAGPPGLGAATWQVGEDWIELLIRRPADKRGVRQPVPCVANVGIVLAHDPEWRGVVAFDSFSHEVRIDRDPPWLPEDRPTNLRTPALWGDQDDTRCANWLARTYDLRLPGRSVREAVDVVARRTERHPVREYLDGVVWDGVPRLATWLERFAGVSGSTYASNVGTWWLISAVARAFQPGCKADHMLILEGGQGKGKSSVIRALVPQAGWFSDSPLDLGSKDSFVTMRGKWIVELAELDALGRAEVSRVKSFLSSAVDSYRPPYGRASVDVPRSLIFAGSVNPGAIGYLGDETGARRFWPVLTRKLDVDGLAAVRDLLWAEAVAEYRDGRQWWPDAESVPELEREQAERFTGDAWQDEIETWIKSDAARRILAAHACLTIGDVLGQALKLDPSKWGRSEQTRVGACLARLGWLRVRASSGSRAYGYRPTARADANGGR